MRRGRAARELVAPRVLDDHLVDDERAAAVGAQPERVAVPDRRGSADARGQRGVDGQGTVARQGPVQDDVPFDLAVAGGHPFGDAGRNVAHSGVRIGTPGAEGERDGGGTVADRSEGHAGVVDAEPACVEAGPVGVVAHGEGAVGSRGDLVTDLVGDLLRVDVAGTGATDRLMECRPTVSGGAGNDVAARPGPALQQQPDEGNRREGCHEARDRGSEPHGSHTRNRSDRHGCCCQTAHTRFRTQHRMDEPGRSVMSRALPTRSADSRPRGVRDGAGPSVGTRSGIGRRWLMTGSATWRTMTAVQDNGIRRSGLITILAALVLVTGGCAWIVRASVNGATQASGPSTRPVLSANGYVAFESTASNLVQNDTNGSQDVFVRNLRSGAVERVSRPADGGEGNGPSGDPAILGQRPLRRVRVDCKEPRERHQQRQRRIPLRPGDAHHQTRLGVGDRRAGQWSEPRSGAVRRRPLRRVRVGRHQPRARHRHQRCVRRLRPGHLHQHRDAVERHRREWSGERLELRSRHQPRWPVDLVRVGRHQPRRHGRGHERRPGRLRQGRVARGHLPCERRPRRGAGERPLGGSRRGQRGRRCVRLHRDEPCPGRHQRRRRRVRAVRRSHHASERELRRHPGKRREHRPSPVDQRRRALRVVQLGGQQPGGQRHQLGWRRLRARPHERENPASEHRSAPRAGQRLVELVGPERRRRLRLLRLRRHEPRPGPGRHQRGDRRVRPRRRACRR